MAFVRCLRDKGVPQVALQGAGRGKDRSEPGTACGRSKGDSHLNAVGSAGPVGHGERGHWVFKSGERRGVIAGS